MDEAALACRFAIASIFLVAGLRKLPRRDEFERVIRRYEVLPAEWATLFSRAVPALEIAGGAALALGIVTRVAAAMIAVLLVAFSGAIAANLLRQRDIDCGCFTTVTPSRITFGHVARNLVYAGSAALVAWRWPRELALDRLIWPHAGVASSSATAILVAATSTVLVTALVLELQHIVSVRRLHPSDQLR